MVKNFISFLIIIFIIFINSSFGQSIKGKIVNVKYEVINQISIVSFDSINGNPREFMIASGGTYNFIPKLQYKNIFLKFSANNYQSEILTILNFDKSKTYNSDILLPLDTTKTLEEIVIIAKGNPIKVKDDTTSFKVSGYASSTDKKIEDVIKKLPGFKVDNTGNIEYKGKRIETVKIDGDDLFGSKYAVGTKNINLELIEQVQAIENYSDNPLLKGLENDEKVAVNLTLKNNKVNISGDINLGLGIIGKKLATEASINGIGLSKKYKSFALITGNNVGKNNTPFDYFGIREVGYTPEIQQNVASKVIDENSFDHFIDGPKRNFNRLFLSSYNQVFKIGKKINVRNNLNLFSDKITFNQFISKSYLINGQRFISTEQINSNKKPLLFDSDLHLSYFLSKKALLEYSAKFNFENIADNTQILQNQMDNYQANLSTKDNFFSQKLLLTKKLSLTKVIQANLNYTWNDIPQNILYNPAVFENDFFLNNNQKSNFIKNTTNAEIVFLSKSKIYNLNSIIGWQNVDIKYKSELLGSRNSETERINGFKNNFEYLKRVLYSKNSIKLNVWKCIITPALNMSLLNQNLKSDLQKDTKSVLVEPYLKTEFKIGQNSKFNFIYNKNFKPFDEIYLFQNPVFQSFNTQVSNKIDLKIQQNNSININYIFNDSYNQLFFRFGGNIIENQGNYFSEYFIDSKNVKIFNFYLAKRNTLKSLNTTIDKFFYKLSTNLKINGSYNEIRFINFVNNSNLRKNKIDNFKIDFSIKTGFNKKFNFQEELSSNSNKTYSSGIFVNKNTFVFNKFNLIYKHNKSNLLYFTHEYYLPNLKNKIENYHFLDFHFEKFSFTNKINYGVSVKNIFNIKNVNQVQNSDYSVTLNNTILLPRMFLISISRNL